MIKLVNSVEAWGKPEFETVLKDELKMLDPAVLPLQQGLSQTSYVTDRAIDMMVLNSTEHANIITVKVGLFYGGIIAGSCCADDPTPVDEQAEYCEVQVVIEKNSAVATISLVEV
jgi:hypothetical protein